MNPLVSNFFRHCLYVNCNSELVQIRLPLRFDENNATKAFSSNLNSHENQKFPYSLGSSALIVLKCPFFPAALGSFLLN